MHGPAEPIKPGCPCLGILGGHDTPHEEVILLKQKNDLAKHLNKKKSIHIIEKLDLEG
jgi:hypothetical protein